LRGMRHCVAVLVIIVATLSAARAQIAGSSPSTPAQPGTTVAGIVECGEGYTSHELYDMKITLLEVIRGDEAWRRIRDANPSNTPPASGTDYVLARVKFEYYARGTPGLCIHSLVPGNFTAYSANGEGYPAASVVPPKPEMRKNLKSGESFEGWLVFAIPKEDKAPLMLYSADKGGAVQHGGGKWFSLR
jgi:hypothetical protein